MRTLFVPLAVLAMAAPPAFSQVAQASAGVPHSQPAPSGAANTRVQEPAGPLTLRSAVAMDVLNKTAAEVSGVLNGIAGAAEVKIEQTTGLPMLTVNIDRSKTARYGLNVGDVQDAVSIAVGGRSAVSCPQWPQ